MKGRTYRYFDGEVQYPFGYGLSYTSFEYAWKQQPQKAIIANDTLRFSVAVKNTGRMNGDEVTQIYVSYPNLDRMPLKELKAFKRVHIEKGREKTIQFKIPLSELQKWDVEKKGWQLYSGEYTISVGPNSKEMRLSTTINIKP